MLRKLKAWLMKIIRLFTGEKEEGLITIGELIPIETKTKLYEIVK